MPKPLLVLFLGAILAAVPVPSAAAPPDNAAPAYGFVCRIVSSGAVAVITPIQGAFAPDHRIRFYDDNGAVCATGIVRSAYPDLVYVAVEGGTVDFLHKGFIASSDNMTADVRMICGFSMNLPMVIEKGAGSGHRVPPNVIVLNYVENAMKPVYFRHYAHDLGCRTCHHEDLDTPCKSCHLEGLVAKKVSFGECVREKCMGCHKAHEGKSAECVWCHK
ncbi:MAG TPA: hypothetical protein VIU29_01660 [Candidatus Deferrimicrobiaceae bacterium]